MIAAELLTKLGFKVDPKGLDAGINHAKSAMSEFKSFLGKLALGYGFLEIAHHVLDAARELENMQAQLLTMTGSVEKTNSLFREMRTFATHSAFQMKDIAKSAESMLTTGMASNKIVPALKRFGDVAGADLEQYKHLVFAYTEVANLGHLQQRQANMFTMTGKFNVQREYAKMMAENAGVMKKGDNVEDGSKADLWIKSEMERLHDLTRHGKFSKEMVDQAFAHATSAGGLYYKHLEHQMNTFTGKFTTMLDNLQLNTAEAAQKLFPIFKALMDFVGNIPLEWLGDAFAYISDSLQYIWKQAGPAIVDAFSQVQGAAEDFMAAVSEGIGGPKGAGSALHFLAMTLGFLISRFMIGVTVLIQFSSMIAKNKALLIGLAAALAVTFGPAMLGKFKLATFAMSLFKAETWQVGAALAKTSLAMQFQLSRSIALAGGYGQVRSAAMAARVSVNQFAASSQLAMGALVAATGWAITKIVECYHALSDLLDEEDHQNNLAQIAELQTQKGLNTQEANRERKAGNNAEANRLDWRNLGLDAQIKALQEKDAASRPPEEKDSFAEFQQQMKEDAERSRKLQEEQLAEDKKNAAAAQKLPDNIAISLHNNAGASRTGMLPDDVLQLAEKAVRARFNIHLASAMGEAS